MNRILLISVFFLILTSCKTTQVQSFYNYEVQCMGPMDGYKQMVKVYGFGNTKDEALEQSRRNAVHTVIFKGIKSGSTEGCNKNPIVTEVNGEAKYKDYFIDFFKADGPYAKFISETNKSENLKSDIIKSGKQWRVGGVYVISIEELRSKLKKDNIIP